MPRVRQDVLLLTQFQRLREAMRPGDICGCGDQEACNIRQDQAFRDPDRADFFNLSVDKERFAAYILLILC